MVGARCWLTGFGVVVVGERAGKYVDRPWQLLINSLQMCFHLFVLCNHEERSSWWILSKISMLSRLFYVVYAKKIT